MTAADFSRFDQTLDALPAKYMGPGGAVAVLRDGKVLAQRSWGWADQDRRLPFTPQTLFRICSISKQFTCATMLDRFADPTVLDADLADFLPRMQARPPVLRLAHNQSGLRDYWAATMLCGSPVEGPFGPDDARDLIGRSQSLQFAPGMRYSYSNHNFRLIGDLVERRCGVDLATLMRRHVFDPAGMPRALLCPETLAMPDGTIGYEGSLEEGWRPAVNRIHWTGDAGIAASLEDMIAWEVAIDAARDDPDAVISRMSAPVSFADGHPAAYGFGLARMTLFGRAAFGHGGGLRGWRSLRFYVPSERISVIVLFNHMSDSRAAAMDLLGAVLNEPACALPAEPDSAWAGGYLEPETGLSAIVDVTPDRKIGLKFAGQGREVLDPQPNGDAVSGQLRLSRGETGLVMVRGNENMTTTLIPFSGPAPRDIEGRFHSAEYDATLTCVSAGGVLYGAFAGFLGRGLMQPLLEVGPDLWRMPCPRALDSAPPGDWTLRFRRENGRVRGVQVGCWLARGIEFDRLGGS